MTCLLLSDAELNLKVGTRFLPHYIVYVHCCWYLLATLLSASWCIYMMYIVVNYWQLRHQLSYMYVCTVESRYFEIWTPHLNRCLAQVQMAWNADTILFGKMGGFFGLTSTWTVRTCVCFIMQVLACLSLKIVSHHCLIEQLDIIVALVCIVQCTYSTSLISFSCQYATIQRFWRCLHSDQLHVMPTSNTPAASECKCRHLHIVGNQQ